MRYFIISAFRFSTLKTSFSSQAGTRCTATRQVLRVVCLGVNHFIAIPECGVTRQSSVGAGLTQAAAIGFGGSRTVRSFGDV